MTAPSYYNCECTMKYQIREHIGDCVETVEASSLEEAREKAQEWLATGDYGDEEDYYSVTITDEEGNETDVELVAGGPTVPPCVSGKRHKWQSPHELVGGNEGNPGEFGCGAGQLRFLEVCCHCGRYRQTITKSVADQYPRTPERVTYHEADEESRLWAGLEGED